MKKIEFDIPIFDWKVSLVALTGKQDIPQLKRVLNKIDADAEDAKQELALLKAGAVNGGDCWTDEGKKSSLIVIFQCTSTANFFEVINHEKRHLIDRLVQYLHIKDIETPAYIDGYVSKQIFNKLDELK